MAYSTFTDDHSNTFSKPYIPNKIVGFHGIDPDLVGSGGSGGGIDDHEQLNNLLGGDSRGHWHMTEAEHEKLAKLHITPSTGIDDHEQLQNLLGGDENGHYHFTEEEWTKIRTLLSITFPYGTETPVFPSSPSTPSEDNPDDPDAPSAPDDDAIPDYSALFDGRDTSWGTLGLGGIYRTVKDEGRMYFGNVVKSHSTRSPGLLQPALVVPAIYNNNANKQLTLLYTTSSDLTFGNNNYIWRNIAEARGITLGDIVYAYIGKTTKLQSTYDYRRHWCFYLTYLESTNKNIYYYRYNGSDAGEFKTGQTGYVAGAYKDDAGNTGDQKIVCATGDGLVVVIGYYSDSKTTITMRLNTNGASMGMSVNPGCLRYGTGVFCATGPQGAANSADGSNWNVNIFAPKNMIGLHYRPDFAYKDKNGNDRTGAFIACSKDTRIFYFSSNGYDWTQCSTKKVPLSSVIAAAYDPNNKRYCVVGTPGNVACFSEDFVNWTPTYVSQANLSVLDITYAFDKFVIMPRDSDTLYKYPK